MGLVLTRKKNESIVIGGCEVRINRISRRYVQLDVTAPEHVRIMREELLVKEGAADAKLNTEDGTRIEGRKAQAEERQAAEASSVGSSVVESSQGSNDVG